MASLRLSCVLALAVCGILHTAARACIIVPLSISNTDGVPSEITPFGTVTLETVQVGDVQGVQFTITSTVQDYFIDKFFFNATPDDAELRLVTYSLTDSVPLLKSKTDALNASEFGKFDFEFNTKDPANFDLTTYSFTVVATNAGVDVSSTYEDYFAPSSDPHGGYIFAGHIKTTDYSAFISGDGSGTEPIPEPASLAVLGLGAALLVCRRRAPAA